MLDEETEIKIKDIFKGTGIIWEESIAITLCQNAWEIKPKADIQFDGYEGVEYLFSSRRDAVRFKKYLVDVFKLEISTSPFYSRGGTLSEVKPMLEEKSGDKEIWSKIVSSVENIPINNLYRD